jgi:ABC-2 type transport system ATP-binding protein
MLKISELSITFGKFPVLNGLSANWEAGKIHGIVGHNGAGKSTFFNVLAGIEKPTGGSVEWDGKPWNSKLLGFLETHNFFYSRITGTEYLRMFPKSNGNFDLDAFQQFFQLPLDDLVEYYSTGMKKKLALLAILKQDKSVFILDEPFNGLDLETNKVLEVTLDILKQKGKTVLISSHILAPLLEICDEIHYLSHGKFEKTYGRDQFSNLDSLLFDDLKEKAVNALGDAV